MASEPQWRSARSRRSRERNRTYRRNVMTLIVVGAMLTPLAIASFWVLSNVASSTAGNADIVVEIQQGWTPAQVGDTLEQKGVIASSAAFQEVAASAQFTTWPAGNYDFVENSGPREALDTLRGGPRRTIPDIELLLPPGLSLQQIADRVGKLEGKSAQRFMEAAQSNTVRSRYQPTDTLSVDLEEMLRTLANRLVDWFDTVSVEGWRWFEDILAYDNARLAQALIAAGHRLGEDRYLRTGLEALDWYATQCAIDSDTVRLVGNRWRRAPQSEPGPTEFTDGDGPGGDEQPLDAAALVEALVEALAATGQQKYGEQAVHAFEWFLGRNRLGLMVYDFATGGCHDGLGSNGVNDNEGAESTLSFLQALLALSRAGLQSTVPRP